jgi:hypothetical protein
MKTSGFRFLLQGCNLLEIGKKRGGEGIFVLMTSRRRCRILNEIMGGQTYSPLDISEMTPQ